MLEIIRKIDNMLNTWEISAEKWKLFKKYMKKLKNKNTVSEAKKTSFDLLNSTHGRRKDY